MPILSELGNSTRRLLVTKVACCRTCAGNKIPIWLHRRAIDRSFGTGKHRVGGRFNPAQVLNSTLIVAIFGQSSLPASKAIDNVLGPGVYRTSVLALKMDVVVM